jgi:hypothetical protein
MRTTLDLDEDILAAIKSHASSKETSAGKVASDLIRKSLTPPKSKRRYRNGVPLFTFPREPGVIVTTEMVKKIQFETE